MSFFQTIEAKNCKEVLKFIEQFAPIDATIFLDIDDTIIAPQSTSFREGYDFIDEMKKHSEDYGNFAEILSNWRLKRRIMLTEHHWLEVMDKLKTERSVYGLTKMDSGSFGSINSMEQWRAEELSELGIVFTQNKIAEKLNIEENSGGPVFYRGIFFTGKASKSESIKFFNSVLHLKFIVLVDDRLEHLQDVEEFCRKNDLKFLGIHFTGAKFIAGNYRAEIAEFQKRHLIECSQWLEDDEVEKLLKSYEEK